MNQILARVVLVWLHVIHMVRDSHKRIILVARVDGIGFIIDRERSSTLDCLAELRRWRNLARRSRNAFIICHMYHLWKLRRYLLCDWGSCYGNRSLNRIFVWLLTDFSDRIVWTSLESVIACLISLARLLACLLLIKSDEIFWVGHIVCYLNALLGWEMRRKLHACPISVAKMCVALCLTGLSKVYRYLWTIL